MKKHFYSHLIEIHSIHIALDELDLSSEEKQELTSLVESSLHHAILDTLLSELPEKEKKLLLSHVVSQDHESVWEILSDIPNVEDKIQNTAHELKMKMHNDIKEAKFKKTRLKYPLTIG